MVPAFSSPILSVAADAVRDLEGHDALFGLWTIFTKCKESLPNGARLENVTWRLWHRELKGPISESPSQITQGSSLAAPSGLVEKPMYQPPTPSASTIFPTQSIFASPTQYSIDALLSSSEVNSLPSYALSPPSTPSRSLSEDATRRHLTRQSRNIGQIVCDYLPSSGSAMESTICDLSSRSSEGAATIYQSNSKTPLQPCEATHPSTIRLPEGPPVVSCLPTPDMEQGAIYQSNFRTPLQPCEVTHPSIIRLPEGPPLVSCLPTPDMEQGEIGASITRTATQTPLPLLNGALVADSASGLLSKPPTLVLVDPTPNPTPHPTPPTSPLVTITANAMQGTRSHWLTPPRLTRCEERTILRTSDSFQGVDPSLRKSGASVVLSRRDREDGCGQHLIQDHIDGRSVSSVASECSCTTTTSVASTTSASSIGYLPDDGEKATHLVGTTAHPDCLQGLSTIVADPGREGIVDAVKTSAENGEEREQKRKTHSTRTPKKPSKPHSAPVSTTIPACAATSHVDQSPHQSPAVPLSTEHPTTPESTLETATDSNPAMDREATNDRSSSPSRSSSAKGSRSREPGNPFADLSGIGTLRGYTIAAAYPPPNMTVRKQVVVGAGKGKVKVAFGRGQKSKVVRRNSAGSALDVGTKEKDKGSGTKQERVKSVEQQSQLEDILETPTFGQQRNNQPEEQPPILTLGHVEKVPQDTTATTSAKQELVTADTPELSAELLTIEEPVQGFKRLPRFNIGSNSDDGSGIGSKSTGSGSSASGGHSLGQCAGQIMEVSHGRKEVRPCLMNEQRLDALLLEEQERRTKDKLQSSLAQQHDHRDTHAEPLQPHAPSPKNAESEHSKAAQYGDNVTHAGVECVQASSRVSDKAKGRAKAVDHHRHAVPASSSKQSSKSKGKSTLNPCSMDPVLAAKVRNSLGEPLLPKGRPVVVEDDSEYETDTEDGSWSDEVAIDEAEASSARQEVVDEAEAQKQAQIKLELVLQEERERLEAERQQQELLLRQMYQQQHQQHHPPHPHHVGRPTGVQRTHSSHYPAPNNARTNKGVQRVRQQQIRDLALHHAKLEQAAKEAQRQRDMIKKLPRESFQDLAKARANSVGLLTQLLKPNPEIFPTNHPYRRGYSSGAIQPIAITPVAPMQPTTSDPGPSADPSIGEKLPPNDNQQQSTPVPQTEATRPLPRRHVSTDDGKRRHPSLSRITSPIRGPPLQLTKSCAARPVSSQVQAGSVSTNGPSSVTVTSSKALGKNPALSGSVAYRPKGPPKDQEMEEDSDSEPETGKIQISKSVAEQKLKALAEKKGIRQHQAIVRPQPQAGPSKMAGPGDEDVPDWARVSQPDRQQRRPMNGLQVMPIPRPPPSAPIPLGHPYNLPAPDPPSTPRTTRRQMLATELSESLRRNLLWERQVSKSNLAAMRRSSSSGVNRHDGLTRLPPFTSIAPVVKLHAKGTIPLEQQEDPAKRVAAPTTEAEKEEMRRHAVARNRSWANEFHYAGW